MIKNFLNPEGHQNPISGSEVTAILLNGWILPIGGASSGEGLCLQPTQQACIMKIWRKRLTDSLNQSMNDEAVFRTALATPGLLNIHYE